MNKSVIFDMDGVLFDTEALDMHCWELVAQEYSLPDVAEVFRKSIGTTAERTKEIFRLHYGDEFPLLEIRQKVKRLYYSKIDTDGPPLKPFVRELLHYLKSNGYSLAVASSTPVDLVHSALQQADILQYFDCIIGGDMVSRSKPNPDIFLAACDKLHAIASETYIIEDSFHGIRAAHAAGANAMMVPDLLLPTEEILPFCTHVFDNLNLVKEFFMELEHPNKT